MTLKDFDERVYCLVALKSAIRTINKQDETKEEILDELNNNIDELIKSRASDKIVQLITELKKGVLIDVSLDPFEKDIENEITTLKDECVKFAVSYTPYTKYKEYLLYILDFIKNSTFSENIKTGMVLSYLFCLEKAIGKVTTNHFRDIQFYQDTHDLIEELTNSNANTKTYSRLIKQYYDSLM